MRDIKSQKLVALVALAFVIVATNLIFPSNAQATFIPLASSLDGSQEVPPVVTLGTGSMTGMLDTDTNLLSWDIMFSGLSGPAVAAHFHGPAPVGSNAGVQVNIGAVSGLASPMVGAAILTDQQEADLLDGLFYINIHTALNPAGEIRGQVQVVPEPGTLMLLVIGIIGIVFYGWRRQKKAA